MGANKKSCLWVLLGLAACRATPGEVHFGLDEADLTGEARGVAEEPPPVSCIGLGRSLRRVREHFEAGAGRTRVVALLEHRLDGLEALRRLLEAPGGDTVQLTLIWDRLPEGEAWRAGLPRDGRVAAFVDRRGQAGRLFARGLLPTSRAREVYLVYAPGSTWPAGTPEVEQVPQPLRWWHRMGRLAPTHSVEDARALGEQLAGALVSRPVGR